METIYWIKNDSECRLAIVTRPRGFDWLDDDLQRLHKAGIGTLVSLLELEEERELGLAEEERLAKANGMNFVGYPIEDRQLARDKNSFRRLVADLARRASSDDGVGVHCRASIGRATVVTACVLVHLGIAPEQALVMIAKTRGCQVPDTEEQRQGILDYKVGT